MKASYLVVAFALLSAAVGCSILTGRSGSGGGGGAEAGQKEYMRELDLCAVGEKCPEGGAKLWGRATPDDYGIVGMVDSTNDRGKYEQTLWIGRSGEHAAALTCSDGILVDKMLCGTTRCIPCMQTRECPVPQRCHYGRCQ